MGIGWETVNWICVSEERGWWQAVLKTVLNLEVS
jgi:hypothetical protein